MNSISLLHRFRKSFPLLISVLASLFLVVNFAHAASITLVPAYGLDTVAGYSAFLTTAQTEPYAKAKFIVQKPNGAKVEVPAISNENGIATAELAGEHTKQTGRYSVSAIIEKPSFGSSQGAATYFIVYPGDVDSEKSSLIAQRAMVKADGNDIAYISLTLRDTYGNPYPDHTVQLISTRPEDEIVAANKTSTTDENGNLTFKVSSFKPGVSVYSAIDVIAEKSLTQSVKIAYSNTYLENVGGDFEQMLMANTFSIPTASAQSSESLLIAQESGQEAGPIHHFELYGLPSVVQPNQNVTVSVIAKDQNNLTVQNYTGTIHFAVEGDGNVVLPADYTFQASDLGVHEFSLGLQFKTAGTYNLIVTDLNNQLVRGEKTVSVGSGGSQNSVPGSNKPVINSPVSGSYSQNQQMISGSAAPGTTIKIFDNEQEIGTVQSNSDATFAYQTAALSDGKHTLYAVALDSNQTVQGTSDSVEIVIDTKAPTVDALEVNPSSGITTGTVLNITVMSEKDLSEAALIFNGEITKLLPSLDQPGNYVASLQAPANAGEYPIDVLLVDTLGNEATYQKAGLVNVGSNGGTATGTTPTTPTTPTDTDTTTNTDTNTNTNNQPPTQVFGVIAYGSDKRVTLVWEASTDDVQVKHYRIYYGLDPANLSEKVDTKDAATTWYIPNLQNGKEYYFAVTAVDNEGLESLTQSEMVSGVPFMLDVQKNVPVRPNEPIQKAPEVPLLKGAAPEQFPNETAQNGPELIFIAAGSGIAAMWMKKKKSKKLLK